ncbi:MAG: hypothetical protein L3J29_06515 [Cyclobacteriaceae bacterium]|nr:hypothetical protein [Cyclobacteriaceae bacterium]
MVEGIYKEYKNENKTKLNVKFKFLVGHLFAIIIFSLISTWFESIQWLSLIPFLLTLCLLLWYPTLNKYPNTQEYKDRVTQRLESLRKILEKYSLFTPNEIENLFNGIKLSLKKNLIDTAGSVAISMAIISPLFLKIIDKVSIENGVIVTFVSLFIFFSYIGFKKYKRIGTSPSRQLFHDDLVKLFLKLKKVKN